MINPALQAHFDAPLRDAKRINQIFLPEGKRSADTRSDDEKKLANANGKLKRERNKARDDARRESLLDYYATTAIPLDRIIAHVGMKEVDVRVAMKKRGRAI